MTAPFPDGLGRRASLRAELDALDVASPTPARVVAAHTERWLVVPADLSAPEGPAGIRPAGEPRLVPARGRLKDDTTTSGGIVTGDWVALDDAGAIAAVLPRASALVRKAIGAATAGQVLAANVDLVLIAEALPDPGVRRIERFAALARSAGLPAVLVATKADLATDARATAERVAAEAGVEDVVTLSTKAQGGASELAARLQPGTTVTVLGRSGAGKSSLVNALARTANLATGEIRLLDGRGRHTTVTRELVATPDGVLLLDTPGLREVATWDGPGDAFADIEELAAHCRFADCGHESEPGCAVRDEIDPDRLAVWRRMGAEQAALDERRSASRDRDARSKRHHQRDQIESRRRDGDWE